MLDFKNKNLSQAFRDYMLVFDDVVPTWMYMDLGTKEFIEMLTDCIGQRKPLGELYPTKENEDELY